MKNAPKILKIVAVVFSASLMVWFVAYRAGAFSSKETEIAKTSDSIHVNPDSVLEITEEDLESMMSTSKSGKVFEPPKAEKPAIDTPPPARTVMGSSKKISNIFPPPEQKKAEDSQQKTIMGSSKSDDIFSRPQQEELNAPNLPTMEKAIMRSSKSAAIFEPKVTDTVKKVVAPNANQPPK